jgi:hypothetical protein
LIFIHNETKKTIKIGIIKRDNLSREDSFKVKIFEPEGGAKISKKD